MTHHRALEAIQQDIESCGDRGHCVEDALALSNELIAAVRAERPSPLIHLDMLMVDWLRDLTVQAMSRNYLWKGKSMRLELERIADAIEASLAPQTPEASDQQQWECQIPLPHDGPCIPPVSLAPVEGWPLHPRHPYGEVGTEWMPETCSHERPDRVLTCKLCALVGINRMAAIIERLEADLSRLTLEYRVHMRNITEGEAHRKAEVADLKAQIKKLEDWDWVITRGKSQCGHWSAHAVTQDGGKSITCLDCDVAELTAEVSRLKAEQEGK